MEGSLYTEASLRLAGRLREPFGSCIGVVIQAYLYRSESDVENLNEAKTRVRLCKGAYKESPSIAFRDRNQVNENYDRLCEILFKQGVYPAIATHDEERIQNALSLARRFGKGPQDFEFQMLLGVRERLARDLLRSGWRVRLYLPYGREWARYFYRRVRERKENFFFALRGVLGR
jgi:proline dehydrogenase